MSNVEKAVKTTQRSALQYALDNLPNAPADIVEKWQGMIAQLDKKSSAERKPTAHQKENAKYKQNILDWMEQGVVYSAADVVKGVPEIVADGVSGSRVIAMLTQLKDAGLVAVTVDKRKNFYSLAE